MDINLKVLMTNNNGIEKAPKKQRDKSRQANIEIRKGDPLSIPGYQTKYLVWPINHPGRPDRKPGGPQLPKLP